MPGFTVTLPHDLSDRALIDELTRRGYAEPVKASDAAWISPTALSFTLGKHPSYICRLVSRCGGKVPGLEIQRAQRGGTASGRIVSVRPGPEFFAYVASRPTA